MVSAVLISISLLCVPINAYNGSPNSVAGATTAPAIYGDLVCYISHDLQVNLTFSGSSASLYVLPLQSANWGFDSALASYTVKPGNYSIPYTLFSEVGTYVLYLTSAGSSSYAGRNVGSVDPLQLGIYLFYYSGSADKYISTTLTGNSILPISNCTFTLYSSIYPAVSPNSRTRPFSFKFAGDYDFYLFDWFGFPGSDSNPESAYISFNLSSPPGSYNLRTPTQYNSLVPTSSYSPYLLPVNSMSSVSAVDLIVFYHIEGVNFSADSGLLIADTLNNPDSDFHQALKDDLVSALDSPSFGTVDTTQADSNINNASSSIDSLESVEGSAFNSFDDAYDSLPDVNSSLSGYAELTQGLSFWRDFLDFGFNYTFIKRLIQIILSVGAICVILGIGASIIANKSKGGDGD